MRVNAVIRVFVSRRFARMMMTVMEVAHVSRDAAFRHYCVVVLMTAPSQVCAAFRGFVLRLVAVKVILIVGLDSPVSRERVSNCPNPTVLLMPNVVHLKSVSLVSVCPPRAASMIENVL